MIKPSPILADSNAAGSRRRVVVTGMGMITPIGHGAPNNAIGFREGATALQRVTLFDTDRMRVQSAGEITLPHSLPATMLTTRESARLDRSSLLLVHAAAEALTQAAWLPADAEISAPLVFGTSEGAMALGEQFYRKALTSISRRQQPSRIHGYYPQSQVLNLCRAFHIRGPITMIANACASGANAIGHAASLIRNGRFEREGGAGYFCLDSPASGVEERVNCRPLDACCGAESPVRAAVEGSQKNLVREESAGEPAKNCPRAGAVGGSPVPNNAVVLFH